MYYFAILFFLNLGTPNSNWSEEVIAPNLRNRTIDEANHSQVVDPCEIFGTVYITKSQYNAQFVVYLEKEEGMADLAVFKEDSKLMADEPGVWYYTESEHFAEYKVYITNDRRMADFSIEYVEDRAFAGCP